MSWVDHAFVVPNDALLNPFPAFINCLLFCGSVSFIFDAAIPLCEIVYADDDVKIEV